MGGATVRVLAIDPAKPRTKRGHASYDGRGLGFGAVDADWAVVEGQWVNAQASKQSLMTLSFYAGFLLGSASAPRFACIPVAVWKGALFGASFANVPKAVFCANIRQLLERRRLPVPESEHDLDAAGLALACFSGKFKLEDYEIR